MLSYSVVLWCVVDIHTYTLSKMSSGIHRGHIEFMRKTRKGCFVRFPYKCMFGCLLYYIYRAHQNTLLVLLGTSGPKSREVSSVLKIGPSKTLGYEGSMVLLNGVYTKFSVYVRGDFPIKEKSSGCVLIWKFKIRACDVLNGKMYFVFIHSLGKYAYVWNVYT